MSPKRDCGFTPFRRYDCMYDPLFMLSGPVDYYKAAVQARMSGAEFQICPIFSNMFSDVPHRPWAQKVMRQVPKIDDYRTRMENFRKKFNQAMYKGLEVPQEDREFTPAIINFPPENFFPRTTLGSPFTIQRAKERSGTFENQASVQVETQYRESSAQTEPWEPPITIIGKGDPEILTLDFLKWGVNVPAGVHEIEIIERARMKNAWMKVINPDPNDEKSLALFSNYLLALELDEWNFREKEIDKIQDMRLQLLEVMIGEVHEASNARTEQKITRVIRREEEELQIKLDKIKRETQRELRKHDARRKSRHQHRHMRIREEHVSKTSEIYAPLMRNGQHPKRWHAVIDEKMKTYAPQFIGVENISTIPKWLNTATCLEPKNDYYMKNCDERLCVRETKWKPEVLRALQQEFRNIHKPLHKKDYALLTKIRPKIGLPPTPALSVISEDIEIQFQCAVLLQKILKGRATQLVMYEGRDNCREFIEELQYSVGLLRRQKDIRAKQWMKVKVQQREELIQLRMVQKLQDTLGKLQGTVVGSLFDFLNKELRRLIEERKAHAVCLIYERERFLREAVESGRRQKEIRRRKEHDEMFKQVIKVTQESVDVYLQDIITEGMHFASEEEATRYIKKMAEKVEHETKEDYGRKVPLDETKQTIKDMVFHFLLPEVDKKIIRNKIALKQAEKLRTVHDVVYSKLKSCTYEAPEPEPDEIDKEVEEDLEAYLTYLKLQTYRAPPGVVSEGFDGDGTEVFITGLLEEVLEAALPATKEPVRDHSAEGAWEGLSGYIMDYVVE